MDESTKQTAENDGHIPKQWCVHREGTLIHAFFFLSQVDRLSTALAKTEEEERACKQKVTELSMKLNDSNQNILSLQERIRQLQRALTTGEHDKRVLEERLDTLKMSQTEGKKANDGLAERCRSLQNEIHDAEVFTFF